MRSFNMNGMRNWFGSKFQRLCAAAARNRRLARRTIRRLIPRIEVLTERIAPAGFVGIFDGGDINPGADTTDFMDAKNWVTNNIRGQMPDSQDFAVIQHDCVLKPGSPSYTVSKLEVDSGFNFLVSSDLAVVQSSYFSGNTAVYGTMTISGLNNGVTANLSTASANVGGGMGNTSTGVLHVGDIGTLAPGDMSVQGTLTIGPINTLTVGGTDGGLGGASGDLDVVGLDDTGPVTDYINGKINVSSSAIFTGNTTIDGQLEAPNGASVTLNGRGLLDSTGKIDGGTIILSNLSTWTVVASGSNLGNMGDGQWLIDGPLVINNAR